jgi:hypothetical protein
MLAGTSVQLAAVAAGGSRVSWSASAGRITANGLYTAPTDSSPQGTVVVSANGASGGHDRRRIAIVPVPAPQAAPSVPLTGSASHPPRGSAAQSASAPRAMVFMGKLAMTTRFARAGRVTLSAYRGSQRIGGCSVQTPANRSFTCLLDLKGASPDTVTSIVSSLRVGGKLLGSGRTVAPRLPLTVPAGILWLRPGEEPSAWQLACAPSGRTSAWSSV